MAMFGRKRKMMGDPNTPANIDAYRQQQSMETPKSGPQWGEIGRNVLGNVGDAIAQYYGVAPTFGPLQRQAQAFQQQGALLAERQRQQATLQAQRIAAQDRQWRERAEFGLANPNDPLSVSMRGAGIDLSSPEAAALYKERAQTVARGPEPFVQADIPGVGRYYGNPSGIPDAVKGAKKVTRPQGMSDGDLLTGARRAIANGADPAAVRQRLIDMGVRDPATM